ncbi:Glycosyltransferase [Synechococcus sp. RCC307]|nr:Glycosyltransferase [Synechococcus sp. RCC307]
MTSSNQPLVSIIIPCFNCASTVLESLQSVQSQTFSNFQCIIVDDCSTDQTQALVMSFIEGDSRFRYLITQSNQGVSSARNLALDNCSSQYIAFLDSDDLWHPEFLTLALDYMSTNSARFVYSPVLRFIDNAKRTGFVKVPPFRVSLSSLLTNNHIPLVTAVFDASLLSPSLRFTPQRPEDYIFWIQLFTLNPSLEGFRFSNLPLGFYRVSPKQRSSNKIINIKRAYYVYRSVWHFGYVKSLFMTLVYVANSLLDYIFQFSAPRNFPSSVFLGPNS